MATLSDAEFRKRVDQLAKHEFFSGEKHSSIQHDEAYTNLSTSVKYRTQALRKLQLEEIQAKAEYEEQCLILNKKYYERLQSSFDSRRKIVNGEIEPESSQLLKQVVDDADYKPTTNTGIPEFWYTTLVNCEMSSGWIEDQDKPLLKHITDIRCKIDGGELANPAEGDEGSKVPTGFTLEFEFSENQFIEDKILTKKYEISASPPEDKNPFEYEGAVISKATGCKITWRQPEKALTKKTIKKKQRNAATGETRTVLRQVPQDSFFNFFERVPEPNMVNDDDEEKEEKLIELEYDFELGEYFKDKLVPNAVLFFTNEYVDPDVESDDEDDDSEEDESSDGDADLTEEEPTNPADNPECKQQ